MLATFVLLSLALLVMLFWGLAETTRFLRTHPFIGTAAELEDFKHLARRNMRAALVALAVGIPWIVLGLYLTITRGGPLMAVTLIVAGGALGWAGDAGKKREAAARSLPCGENLRSEYESVGERWLRKALPDF